MHVRLASDKALPSPSEHQRAILAFIRSGVGHGVVRATAGSGKTTTLVQVAHSLPRDLRVCFLAFARDAATELRTRLPVGVGAHTVHSVGLRTLRSYLKKRKVELGKVNPRKYRDLIKAELGEVKLGFGVSDKALKPCEDYLRDLVLYARLNLTNTKDPSEVRVLAVRYNLRPPGDTALEDELHVRLRSILRDGTRLALRGDLDYPDMIYVPHILNLPPPQYDFVCVDEAQDYSALALEFTMQLVSDGGRLLFVGDPRQSIFGFAGADTDALERIVRRSDATVLPLSVTY
nr:UvrD-helicase domain-containing protein [Deinococcota bacterium]